MGRKIEIKGTVNKDFNFTINFATGQSGAHDMCHACHTLDTPLRSTLPNLSQRKFHWSWNFWEIFSVISFLKNFTRMKRW